jgi:hypothetical protein
MEDTEWIYDITKGIWTQSKAEQVSEEVRKMSKRELNEAKVRIFEHFLESIARKK